MLQDGPDGQHAQSLDLLGSKVSDETGRAVDLLISSLTALSRQTEDSLVSLTGIIS